MRVRPPVVAGGFDTIRNVLRFLVGVDDALERWRTACEHWRQRVVSSLLLSRRSLYFWGSFN